MYKGPFLEYVAVVAKWRSGYNLGFRSKWCEFDPGYGHSLFFFLSFSLADIIAVVVFLYTNNK